MNKFIKNALLSVSIFSLLSCNPKAIPDNFEVHTFIAIRYFSDRKTSEDNRNIPLIYYNIIFPNSDYVSSNNLFHTSDLSSRIYYTQSDQNNSNITTEWIASNNFPEELLDKEIREISVNLINTKDLPSNIRQSLEYK